MNKTQKENNNELMLFVNKVSSGNYLSATEPGVYDSLLTIKYINIKEDGMKLVSLWGGFSAQKSNFEKKYEPIGITQILKSCYSTRQLFPNHPYLSKLIMIIPNIVTVVLAFCQCLPESTLNKADEEIYETCFDSIYNNTQFADKNIVVTNLEWIYSLFYLKAELLYYNSTHPFMNEIDALCDLLFAGYLPLEVNIKPNEKTVITAFYGDFLGLFGFGEQE